MLPVETGAVSPQGRGPCQKGTPLVTLPHHGRRIYFAYGSNLHLGQMRQRCPSARPLRTYVLADYRLAFREFADIEPSPGEQVAGALYDVGPEDVAALDIYEGVEGGFYAQVEHVMEDGTEMFFYRMPPGPVSPPTQAYLDIILAGLRDWNLPANRVLAAMEEATGRPCGAA